MHMLIRVLAPADSASEAVRHAQNLFETANAPLIGPFDYGRPMNETGARWRESMSEELQETGAVPYDSEEGQELVENGLDNQRQEFARNLAVVREAIERLGDTELSDSRQRSEGANVSSRETAELGVDDLMEDPQVEADVESWEPLGLGTETDTKTGWFRHACYQIGQYTGSANWLYDATSWMRGSAIRSPGDLDDVVGHAEDDDRTLYVIPMDVHY